MASKLSISVVGLCALVHDKTDPSQEKIHILMIDARQLPKKNPSPGPAGNHDHAGGHGPMGHNEADAGHLHTHTPMLLFDASAYKTPVVHLNGLGNWQVGSHTDAAGRILGAIKLDKDVLSLAPLRTQSLDIDNTQRTSLFPGRHSPAAQSSLHWVPSIKSIDANFKIKRSAIDQLDGVVARLTLDRGTIKTLSVSKDPTREKAYFPIWEFYDRSLTKLYLKQALAEGILIDLDLSAASDEAVISSSTVDGKAKNRLSLLPTQKTQPLQLTLANLSDTLPIPSNVIQHFSWHYEIIEPFIADLDARPLPNLPPGDGFTGSGSLCPLVKDTQP